MWCAGKNTKKRGPSSSHSSNSLCDLDCLSPLDLGAPSWKQSMTVTGALAVRLLSSLNPSAGCLNLSVPLCCYCLWSRNNNHTLSDRAGVEDGVSTLGKYLYLCRATCKHSVTESCA